MIRIINHKTGLYKEINADNLSFKDFLKILEFYSNLENFQVKYYKM